MKLITKVKNFVARQDCAGCLAFSRKGLFILAGIAKKIKT